MTQLIPGFYRCDNCELDVGHIRRTRRFRLCDHCWSKIMPSWDQTPIEGRDPAWIPSDLDQQKEIEHYWEWYWKMEKKKPARHHNYSSWRGTPIRLDSDRFYPYCACGRPRKLLGFGEPGLFGGPYQKYCEYCEMIGSIDAVFRMSNKIHPDYDKEDWLDLLYKTFPIAFEMNILPDYWFYLILRENL